MLTPLLLLTSLLACSGKDDAPGDGGTDGGGTDADGDGFDESEDCDDSNAAVYPGASERCNGVDDDCDGLLDDADDSLDASTATTFYLDADGDAYGSTPKLACDRPDGYVTNNLDCDDTEAARNPGAREVCDGLDNDCDGLTDQEDDSLDPSSLVTGWLDEDGDGYGSVEVSGCEVSAAEVGGDCDDANPAVHPGASEVCDGQDNDCDSATSESGMIAVGSTTYSNLSGAIAAAGGSEIQLCSGTYTGTYTTTGNVKIRGVSGASATILQGRGSNPVFTLGGDLELTGVTVTGGVGTYTGGIDAFTAGSALTIRLKDCIFRSNQGGSTSTGGGYGGAILAYNDSTVHAENCEFTSNTAYTSGGAIYASNLHLVNTTFSSNSATYGGAIMIDSGELSADASTSFSSNTASYYGGGIILFGAAATLDPDTTLTGNSAALGGALLAQNTDDGTAFSLSGGTYEGNTATNTGGGVYLAGDYASGTGMTIRDNSAMYGGGLALEGTGVEVSDSDISDNSATSYGGGVIVWEYAPGAWLAGLLIDNNDAPEGGGVYFDGVVGATLDECDLTNNTADSNGAGIYLLGSSLSIDQGSFTSNQASGLGGAILLSGSTLSAFSTNWGERSTDNGPDDLYLLDTSTAYTYAGRSSINCDTTSCY